MAMVQHRVNLSRSGLATVSVCIANYQGESLLRDCLESVLTQEFPGTLEILVHDDASTDSSVALLSTHFPEAAVIVSEKNVGFAVANNRMAAAARGTHLLLLNNDAALQPGAIRALLAESEAHPHGIATLPQYDWETGALVDRGCFLDPFYNPVPNLNPARNEVAMGIGACLFLPRSFWDDLGGFPEWMGSLAEDVFLCSLARLCGRTVSVARGSGYRHRQGHSFGGNRIRDGRLRTTVRRRALSERNKTSALVVLTPGMLVWPLLALHMTLLLCEGFLLTILLRSTQAWRSIYWPALCWPLRQWSLLRAQRKRAQAMRRVSIAGYFATTRWFPRKLAMLRRYGLPSIR
jgi:GT2 family glycosyltransferase